MYCFLGGSGCSTCTELLLILPNSKLLLQIVIVSWKDKAFLAIDNVWDNSKSIEQARMFLQAPFHEV